LVTQNSGRPEFLTRIERRPLFMGQSFSGSNVRRNSRHIEIEKRGLV